MKTPARHRPPQPHAARAWRWGAFALFPSPCQPPLCSPSPVALPPPLYHKCENQILPIKAEHHPKHCLRGSIWRKVLGCVAACLSVYMTPDAWCMATSKPRQGQSSASGAKRQESGDPTEREVCSALETTCGASSASSACGGSAEHTCPAM